MGLVELGSPPFGGATGRLDLGAGEDAWLALLRWVG